jgi:hypothetical protein
VYSKEEIIQDVRKWSEEFLEIPNKHLGGFPACPFAKKTWNDHKVVIETKRKFKQYKAELNGHLNGFPACPYAKKTWQEKNVLVEVKPKNKWYKSQLNHHLDNIIFNNKIYGEEGYDLLIFCDPYFNYSTDDFQDVIDEYNDWYNTKDLFFMGFHPDNPANVEEQEFLVSPSGEKMPEEEGYNYSMMLIQKFSLLQEASDKLHKSGYYKEWPVGYYQDVVAFVVDTT